jgi:hypothetical protein
MDGFIGSSLSAWHSFCSGHSHDPTCVGTPVHRAVPDVIGYHTAAEIPNYWTYAHRFVLQDHLFEGVRSWSLPPTWTWSPDGARGARTTPIR